jgi:hypothetical protein
MAVTFRHIAEDLGLSELRPGRVRPRYWRITAAGNDSSVADLRWAHYLATFMVAMMFLYAVTSPSWLGRLGGVFAACIMWQNLSRVARLRRAAKASHPTA